MLVTVIRSYTNELVELPDGEVLLPYKFVEYTSLPDSFKSELNDDGTFKKEENGKPSGGLQKLVDAGLVKIAQIQDIGHLMVEGSAANRLPVDSTGVYVPAAGATSQDERARIEKKFEDKPDNITENSRVGLLSTKAKASAAEFIPPVKELTAKGVTLTQIARGVEVSDEAKSALLAQVQAGSSEVPLSEVEGLKMKDGSVASADRMGISKPVEPGSAV